MTAPTLAGTWTALRAAGKRALIPYLTAGYPSRGASLEAIRRAAEVSDILEVGVPFSDPLADGPTIQRASFEALGQGMTLEGTLELVAEAQSPRPVVIFSYLNPVLRYGVDRFLAAASDLGVAGLLLTDLPAGADPALEAAITTSRLDLIRLVAPTTPDARLAAALDGARGFVYLIGRLGVTGARATLAQDLDRTVARVRTATSLPLAVGFGISTPAQAAAVAALADGVVVGSAVVDVLGREGPAAASRFLQQMRNALDGKGA